MRFVLVLLVACSGSRPSPMPCERAARVEVRAVDNNSDYMKAVYAHLAGGAPAEGIRAEIDQWSSDIKNADGLFLEKRRETDYYVSSLDERTLREYVASLTTTKPPPSDRALVIEHVDARPELAGNKYLEAREHWRTYYVNATPALDNASIASVRADENPITGHPDIFFELTDAGRELFTKVTTTSTYKKLATLVDGAVVNAPIVNGPITGGRFDLTFRDPATRDALLARLACKK